MIDKLCPVCGEVHPARVTRTGPSCAEWECSGCGGKWTMKDGDTDAYAFFPPDIDAVLDDDVQPFFAES